MTHADTPGHELRVKYHLAAGDVLKAADQEWAAVCYFYAAFHGARAAMLEDLRLNSDSAARAANPRLSLSSRHVQFHNGHPKRGPGVNDIVRYLYPEIGAIYSLLHIRSVEVRYAMGLTAGTIGDVRDETMKVIAELETRGLLRL